MVTNYKGTRLAARAVMQAHDFEPIEELIKLFKDPLTPLEERIGIAKSLAPYSHAKLAQVTITREDEGGDTGIALELARRIVSDPRAAALASELLRRISETDHGEQVVVGVARQLVEGDKDRTDE